MTHSFETHGDVLVLTLSGDLAGEGLERTRRAVGDRLGAGVRSAIVDCGHVGGADSAGLEFLLWLQGECARRGGRLTLVRPDETLDLVLRIVGLRDRFETASTIEEAGRSIRAAA
jgi:anti-anti-sigma factor